MSISLELDNGWRFFRGDLPPQDPADGWGGAKARAYSNGAAAVDFDDSDWRELRLPHDFVSEGSYCFDSGKGSDMGDIPEMESIDSRLYAGGCLEGGAAWYRKKFRLPEGCGKKRIYIHFDGVYRNSAVYVNQYYAGTHVSGYGAFYYDITDFADPDGENLVAVRVDASRREGWWYEGGGIYRHVRLEIADEIHIAPYGLFAYAENVDSETGAAELNIRFEAVNRSEADTGLTALYEIAAPSGEVIFKGERELHIPAWDSVTVTCSHPASGLSLWDTENTGAVYTATVKLCRGGRVTDVSSVSFGVRDMRFDAGKGFFLNGRHMKIKGVCCHGDTAGAGIGVPDKIKEELMKSVKHMGANAVRISHYPPSPELLEICDRLGILVFAETRRMSSAPEDIEALRMMVRQGRNHPSVFLWGIGNEEIFSQHRPETARTTVTMRSEIKKLDPTRPVTSSVVCWDGVKRYDSAEKYVYVTRHLDVMGFNYCQTAWDDYHRRMPNQPVIITEESSNGSTRGCYETDEAAGHYYPFDKENAGKCSVGSKADRYELGERAWKAVAEREYIAGEFIWTAFDYRGEPTPLKGRVISSQFGVMDYCGIPKDGYYYYAAWWSGRDILHIFPNGARALSGSDIYCYSNMDEAELFADGVSLGRKAVERNWYVMWENVSCSAGGLTVRGYKNGKPVMEKTAPAAGKPSSLTISCGDSVEKGETTAISVYVADENKNTVPDACNALRFEVIGAELIGTGNGDPADTDSEKTAERRAFNGVCRVLIRAGENDIIFRAASDGLTGAERIIKIKQKARS